MFNRIYIANICFRERDKYGNTVTTNAVEHTFVIFDVLHIVTYGAHQLLGTALTATASSCPTWQIKHAIYAASLTQAAGQCCFQQTFSHCVIKVHPSKSIEDYSNSLMPC